MSAVQFNHHQINLLLDGGRYETDKNLPTDLSDVLLDTLRIEGITPDLFDNVPTSETAEIRLTAATGKLFLLVTGFRG